MLSAAALDWLAHSSLAAETAAGCADPNSPAVGVPIDPAVSLPERGLAPGIRAEDDEGADSDTGEKEKEKGDDDEDELGDDDAPILDEPAVEEEEWDEDDFDDDFDDDFEEETDEDNELIADDDAEADDDDEDEEISEDADFDD